MESCPEPSDHFRELSQVIIYTVNLLLWLTPPVITFDNLDLTPLGMSEEEVGFPLWPRL
jgi:hypothetical protein